MDFIPTEISQWTEKYLSADNSTNNEYHPGTRNKDYNINLPTDSVVRLTLLDFYNDIKNYKDAVKDIKKVQSEFAKVQHNTKKLQLEEINEIDPFTIQKYTLLRPISGLSEKKPELSQPWRKLQNDTIQELPRFLSDTTIQSCSNINNVKNPIRSKISKKSIIKIESLKTVLIAEPEIIEFFNYESHRTYKKTVIIRNVDTQLARFKIESRPSKSPFTIFFESARKVEKENIAPGMYAKLIVYFRCDVTVEPEELLKLIVFNGKPVTVKMRGHRDPPRLKALGQTFSFSSAKRFHDSSTSSSDIGIQSTDCSDIMLSSNPSFVKMSAISNPPFSYAELKDSTFDCKKCFIGEFIVISTLLKNNGGKGRFFIMSEMDWCSMKIEDLSTKNMLILPPFAIYPAYFILQPLEQITLHVYFFPESRGLQVDELHIISDNCGIRTVEVIGDGVAFEPQMLQFDKNIKYQWFQTRNKDFCTIHYLDLGSGAPGDILKGSFTISSKCELDLFFRWEISNSTPLCPAERKNTVGRQELKLNQVHIEPITGVFENNSSTTFRVLINLSDLVPENYRTTLRLIIEDIPFAAVPQKYNYLYEEAFHKRRLSDRVT